MMLEKGNLMINFGHKAEQDIVDKAVHMNETDEWMIVAKRVHPDTKIQSRKSSRYTPGDIVRPKHGKNANKNQYVYVCYYTAGVDNRYLLLNYYGCVESVRSALAWEEELSIETGRGGNISLKVTNRLSKQEYTKLRDTKRCILSHPMNRFPETFVDEFVC